MFIDEAKDTTFDFKLPFDECNLEDAEFCKD